MSRLAKLKPSEDKNITFSLEPREDELSKTG